MSTEPDDGGYYPMRDAEDEQLAHELIEQKNQAREAVNEAARALQNDDVALTDGHAEAIEDVGVALRAFSNTLADRADRD